MKRCTKVKKTTLCDNVSELCNEYLGIYFDQYMALPDAEKRKLGNKDDPKIYF